MGTGKAVAVILNVFVTLTLALSLASPWWRVRRDSNILQELSSTSEKLKLVQQKHEFLYCFVDGTCRTFPSQGESVVMKDNKDAQIVYDVTLIFMLASLLPFILYLHFFFFKYSRSDDHNRALIGTTGTLAFVLVLLAVLAFSIGLPKKGHFDDLFGRADNAETIYNRWTEVEHEPFLGWFFAVVTLALLIPSTLVSTVPKRRNPEELPTVGRSQWTYYD